jgi:hypothetical protein
MMNAVRSALDISLLDAPPCDGARPPPAPASCRLATVPDATIVRPRAGAALPTAVAQRLQEGVADADLPRLRLV